jgi:hypothetical protein
MKAMKMIVFILAILFVGLSQSTAAMTLTLAGDQLILAGPVVEGDGMKIFQALQNNPTIRTVILRNSPGGDVETGYEVGDLMRARGMRTAVSGYCNSSCSRMFLGGKERIFTDDYPVNQTRVGFHGHYNRRGQLNRAEVGSRGLKEWIIQHSDGKADPHLVERWINIPVNRGMISFFHQKTFFCEHGPVNGSIFKCEPIAKTALELGVITSLELIHSNDQAKGD